jgi:hypothetical protein
MEAYGATIEHHAPFWLSFLRALFLATTLAAALPFRHGTGNPISDAKLQSFVVATMKVA